MVKVNGKEIPAAGKVLSAFLQEENYCLKRIVVEKNREIVPKADYEVIVLADGDEIEVVSFVGGG